MIRAILESAAACTFFAALVLPFGCVPTDPSPVNLQPFVAVTGHYSVLVSGKAAPEPPAPPSDKCATCRGTGKADGRVTCPVCGGTGKATKAATATPAVPVKRIVYQPPIDCRDGSCPPPTIVH